MTETTRTIKPKPFKVTDPDGKTHLAYASTLAGAIRDVKAATKVEQTWSAELATPEDLVLAGRRGDRILNAPASIQGPDADEQLALDMQRAEGMPE